MGDELRTWEDECQNSKNIPTSQHITSPSEHLRRISSGIWMIRTSRIVVHFRIRGMDKGERKGAMHAHTCPVHHTHTHMQHIPPHMQHIPSHHTSHTAPNRFRLSEGGGGGADVWIRPHHRLRHGQQTHALGEGAHMRRPCSSACNMRHATCDMQHHPPFPFLLLPSSHPSSLPPIHPPTEFSPQLTAAPHQWTLFCGENAPFPPDAGGGVDTNHHHHQCTPLSMRPEPFVWYRMQSICITSTSTAQHSTAQHTAVHHTSITCIHHTPITMQSTPHMNWFCDALHCCCCCCLLLHE